MSEVVDKALVDKNVGNDLVAAQKHIDELSSEIDRLKKELKRKDDEASVTITGTGGDGSKNDLNDEKSQNTHLDHSHGLAHPGRRGYLFKWRDRAIGWGGTKWGLRFVVLEQGRLAYYRSHRDIAPRYVLVLNECAVRDEGFKSKKTFIDHVPLISSGSESSTPTEDFHVFSIYRRPKNNNSLIASNTVGQQSAETDNEHEITPLLRFSTESKEEKMLWIDFISQACAYCESDEFLSLQATNTPILLDQLPASPPLSLEPGKLPPIFFRKPRIIQLEPMKRGKAPSGAQHSLSKRGNYYRKMSNAGKVTHLRSTYPPSRPMHKSSGPSYLSTEAPHQNYRGLLNLALIMLVISHFNILLHTITTQGFILTNFSSVPLRDFIDAPLEDFPFITGMGLLPIFLLYTYFIERRLCEGRINESYGLALHFLNANLALLVPLVIVWCFIPNPVTGATLSMASTILWMKLISYILANADYRTSKQDSYQATLALITDLEDGAHNISYPSNITLSNIFYFWFAPTLTYQMAFPKSQKIRWTKVISIVFRLIVALAMLLFFCAQIIMPNLDILTEEYKKHGKLNLDAEYLTKLALASTYTWLLFFYIYFHLFLNLIAEVLKFGDRVFYKDWWNASEVSSYWRLWNLPVHYWMIRHVYFPCIRMRMSKNAATFVVFLISAIIHEILISVPFHIVSFWSFFGMMGQIPLITFTKYFDSKFQGSSYGNIIFWLSFCIVGQPMAILMYAVDFWDKSASNDVNNTNSAIYDGISNEL